MQTCALQGFGKEEYWDNTNRPEATYFRQQSEDKGYSDFTFHLLMEGDALKLLFALAADGLSLDAGNPRVKEPERLWVSRSMDQQWSRQKWGSFFGALLGAAAAYLLMFVLKDLKGGLSLGLDIGGIAAMIILRKKTHASSVERYADLPVLFPADFIPWYEIFAIKKR